jgi:hypothetical protein
VIHAVSRKQGRQSRSFASLNGLTEASQEVRRFKAS